MTVDTQKLRELLSGLPLVAWSKTRSTVKIPETEDFAGKQLPITSLDKQYARRLAGYIAAANPATVSALLDEIDRLRADRDALKQAFEDANETLATIGDYAHNKSTGPMRPDALWEIRSMAYDAVRLPGPANCPAALQRDNT